VGEVYYTLHLRPLPKWEGVHIYFKFFTPSPTSGRAGVGEVYFTLPLRPLPKWEGVLIYFKFFTPSPISGEGWGGGLKLLKN